ncbi:MAG: NAD(P)H-dependent glycerol-3-phosphate dehydrogenase [Bacteroidota bacterium]
MVGILGAGSFGTALANIIAQNKPVLLYVRNPKSAEKIGKEGTHKGYKLSDNITLTSDLEKVPAECELLFPVVPSGSFPDLILELSSYLKPSHVLIHGTKGLSIDVEDRTNLRKLDGLKKEDIQTMSELIVKETPVLRVGCIAGPNLAVEILKEQPAATVVASRFEQVIKMGMEVLRSSRFKVYGSHDLLGIELAGVLKNIMAIASGMLHGLDYGDNTKSLLVAKGLEEMITVAKGLGADPRAFLGLAGIGDLVATCYSPLSRNFTLGYRMAKGESLAEITSSMEEVAEGLNTVAIVRALSARYRIPAPITQALFRILFDGMDIEKGMNLLMEYPYKEDVGFL